MKTYYSENAEETKELANQLAQWIADQELRQEALVLALTGELGAGKTTFVQGLASFLRVEGKILSPTFVILKKFNISVSDFETFYHIDCYRIGNPEEILKLDFKEIVENPKNLVVIEWADKIKSILPEHYLKLNFEVYDKKKRKINVSKV